MKKINSIAQSMIEMSQKTSSENVFNSIISSIKNISGFKYSDVEIEEESIIFNKDMRDSDFIFIAERIANIAQQYGYLIVVSPNEDFSITTMNLRPFNEDDYSLMVKIQNVEFNNYGCFNIDFLPSATNEIRFNVHGVFESASSFDELIEDIECDELACVYSSAYHRSVTDDGDDYVKVAM